LRLVESELYRTDLPCDLVENPQSHKTSGKRTSYAARATHEERKIIAEKCVFVKTSLKTSYLTLAKYCVQNTKTPYFQGVFYILSSYKIRTVLN
jgi:hypothetical protein